MAEAAQSRAVPAPGSLRLCLTTEAPVLGLWPELRLADGSSAAPHLPAGLDEHDRAAMLVSQVRRPSWPFTAAMLGRWRWPSGSRLGVRFLNGSPTLRERTMAVASAWSAAANVRFEATTDSSAPVRVRFTASNASWARLGTTEPEVYANHDSATVLLGNLTEATPADSFHAVVLHEFGHTLGLVHEHQRPESPLDWNEAETIDYFARTYGWNRDAVRAWVFGQYPHADVLAGAYDSLSVMHYPLPGALTYSGRGAPLNHTLSERDRRSIAIAYHE
jgi:hypothetical protein